MSELMSVHNVVIEIKLTSTFEFASIREDIKRHLRHVARFRMYKYLSVAVYAFVGTYCATAAASHRRKWYSFFEFGIEMGRNFVFRSFATLNHLVQVGCQLAGIFEFEVRLDEIMCFCDPYDHKPR